MMIGDNYILHLR